MTYIFLIIFSFSISFEHMNAFNINNNKPNHEKPTECIIKNNRYKEDFLYLTQDNKYEELKINKHVRFGRKIYSNTISPKSNIKDPDQRKWLFVPTILFDTDDYQIDQNQTYFYIINKHYLEFLCATSYHHDLTNHRRRVFTFTMEDAANMDECKWRLNEVKNKEMNYELWNVKYNEPLYAASNFLQSSMSSHKRNVFTWYKSPDSKQFYWTIFCFDFKLMSFYEKQNKKIET